MLAGMRPAGIAALCALVIGLWGCGGGGDDEEATGGLAQEAAAVVEQLERSIAAGEFERVCSELLSAEVRRQAGGGDCPAMLERTSAGVRRPRIEVKAIRIEGATAAVDVVTVAEGQDRVEDTIRLVREAGAYRISSLSG
jgi:hypothetical protein